MGGAGTSPPPRRPAATRGAVGARGAYVTCQVSTQVCFEIYSRFETQMFVSSGEVRDLILESLLDVQGELHQHLRRLLQPHLQLLPLPPRGGHRGSRRRGNYVH